MVLATKSSSRRIANTSFADIVPDAAERQLIPYPVSDDIAPERFFSQRLVKVRKALEELPLDNVAVTARNA
jgi:hypothetical protein